jgi:hypothetical protein
MDVYLKNILLKRRGHPFNPKKGTPLQPQEGDTPSTPRRGHPFNPKKGGKPFNPKKGGKPFILYNNVININIIIIFL